MAFSGKVQAQSIQETSRKVVITEVKSEPEILTDTLQSVTSTSKTEPVSTIKTTGENEKKEIAEPQKAVIITSKRKP